MRLNNVTDGYAVNGWESETIENHSGQDVYGNPKADPAIMAYYNQPLYVAVKTRSQFAQIPGEVAVDFYAINGKSARPAHARKSPRTQSRRRWKCSHYKEVPVTSRAEKRGNCSREYLRAHRCHRDFFTSKPAWRMPRLEGKLPPAMTRFSLWIGRATSSAAPAPLGKARPWSVIF